MRILVVDISSKVGALGGAQRVSASLFYELRKRGFETYYLGCKTVFMEDDKNAFFIESPKQKKLKNTVERLGLGMINETTPVRIGYYMVLHSLLGTKIKGVEKWIEEIKPDVVISNSINDFVLLKSIRKYLGNAKLVFVEHANASGIYSSMFDRNILALTFGTGAPVPLAFARKRFFKFFDMIVALNKEQYRKVTEYNKNAVVIHSSPLISVKKIDRKALEEVRKELGLDESNKVVLSWGRLADMQKNISTLIKAFETIDDSSMRLIVAGNGKSEEAYRNLAKGDKRIMVLTGKISDERLSCYYGLADLFVLPSFWESFNANFIEAAYFGVPLLLSTKSINEDIIEQFDGRLFTFNPYSVEELAGKIKLFFSDKRKQQELLALSQDIAATYSKDKQIEGYVTAMKRLAEKA
jgi:glycosyltransferase involved in cell wall biosynthesis